MVEKRKSGGRPKQNYTLEEAADYLGVKPVDLLRSRYRGLKPGTLGAKNKAGIMIWKIQDLRGQQPAAPESAEDASDGVVYESGEQDTTDDE